MPKLQCIKCGRKIKEREVLCKECKRKSKEEVKINITFCKECGRYKIKKNWHSPKKEYESLEEALQDIFRLEEIEKRDHEYIGKNDALTLIKVNYGICDECSRMYGGYYEAIIQIRGSEHFVENKTQEICLEIENSKMPRNFITKIVKVKGGKDIYVGSKQIAKKIFKRCNKKKYVLKESYTFYGIKDGKRIYRNVYLIKERGDA